MRTLYLLFVLSYIPISQLFAETLSPPTVTSKTIPDTCSLGVGAIDLTVSGDFPPFTFQWSNGATTEDLVDITDGDYNVIVTNANGESTAHFVTVANIMRKPQFNTQFNINDGCDDHVNGSASVIMTPPIPGATFLWNTGETTQSIHNIPGGHYSVTVSIGSCSHSKKVQVLQFLNLPSVTSTTENSICGLSDGSIDINVHGELEPYLFEWSTGETTEDLTNALPGNYTVTVTDANGCSAVTTLNVANNSSSFSLAGAALPNNNCAVENGSVNLTVSPAGAYTFLWSNGETTEDLGNLPSGTYTLLVTSSANGCSASDAVLITQKELVASFALEQPDCARNTGSILIQNVLDATLPIQYTLQGGSQQASGNLFSNLTPGDYTIEIEDADGCTTSVSATIDPAPSFQITVEPQITISLGESYQIDPSVNIDPSEIAQVIWTPATGLSCSTCLSTMVEMPMTTQQYRLDVMTKAGCRDDATLILKVDKQVNVYIPNIFSPNGDGENEGFTVFAEWSGVRSVKTLQIFSRWGEQIFVRENFPPNDPALGWDGRFKGVEMNPGVFVYYALVELVNGQEVVYKGDVTLMR